MQFMYLPTLRALFSLMRVMQQRRFNRCRPPLASTSRWAVLASTGFRRSIRRTFAARHALRRISPAAAAEFQRIVEASSSSIPWTPGAPAAARDAPSRATPRRQKALTTICLRFGRTPTQTFGLSKKHGLSTPGCREAAYPYATSHDSLTALATRPDREWRMNAGTTSTSCCSPRSIFPRQSAGVFLRNACGGDEQLEEAVRSLLAAHDRADNLLGTPAIDSAAHQLAESRGNDSQSDPLIGQTFSHYRIARNAPMTISLRCGRTPMPGSRWSMPPGRNMLGCGKRPAPLPSGLY